MKIKNFFSRVKTSILDVFYVQFQALLGFTLSARFVATPHKINGLKSFLFRWLAKRAVRSFFVCVDMKTRNADLTVNALDMGVILHAAHSAARCECAVNQGLKWLGQGRAINSSYNFSPLVVYCEIRSTRCVRFAVATSSRLANFGKTFTKSVSYFAVNL